MADQSPPLDPTDTGETDEPENESKHSRRLFLGLAGAGAGAAVVVGAPGVAGALQGGRNRGRDGGRDGGRGGRNNGNRNGRNGGGDGTPGPDRFFRMFNDNEVNGDEADELRQALIELSRPGGILDANDPIEVGPVRLITEPELSPNNRDNPNINAGNTFIGQFLDHDITRDAGSRLGRRVGLRRSMNLRSASFDLDSVYAGGPGDSPELYNASNRFLVESGGQFEDLPRDADGRAIIGDSRNDENMMISGLHASFLLFHNAVLDRVESAGGQGEAAFAEAQRLVRWHYQWMILHEYLPAIVGADLVNDIVANGRRFYTDDDPRIPVEFQTSAFRFGHSQVRPSYRANMAGDNGDPFFAFVFDPETFGDDDPNDLTGGHRAPRRFIGWQTFFDFDDGEMKNNKRIEPSISSTLFRLPAHAIGAARGEDIGPTSLATRNLLRHITWEVATGQQVANEMGVAPLSTADLSAYGDFGANLDSNTPLWLYIMREAELVNDGLQLGPVGGRIVAEVFIGLLDMDDSSFFSAEPNWRPTLPTRAGDGDFGMADLLTIAGVDPDSRGQ